MVRTFRMLLEPATEVLTNDLQEMSPLNATQIEVIRHILRLQEDKVR